jgi:hypothetical protein
MRTLFCNRMLISLLGCGTPFTSVLTVLIIEDTVIYHALDRLVGAFTPAADPLPLDRPFLQCPGPDNLLWIV